jgi:Fe-S-cluster containining protein
LFKSLQLHEGDGPRIARGLGMDLKEFYAQHCDQANYQTLLKFPCPGLQVNPEGASCQIYDCRGASCRLFPLAKLGDKSLQTIAIDLRCPTGAELAEEFRKEAAARKAELHRN